MRTSSAHRRARAAFFSALLLLAVTAVPLAACAQAPAAQSLAERSSVIVRGRVVKARASDEPMVHASDSTAVITVLQMYAGREIAGDQRGRTATVILSKPNAAKAGDELLFFGNVRFLGRTMTIADEGEMPAQRTDSATTRALTQGIQARRDMPVAERLAAASVVFRGTVESVRRLERAAQPNSRGAAPATEHDPEWTAANVRVTDTLRGRVPGPVVTIVFAASRDVTWFNSPKLRVGEDAIFLAHAPTEGEAALLRTTALGATPGQVYLVTEPYDVLPPTAESRVRSLLSTPRER